MTIASHAKGRGFNPLTAHTSSVKNVNCSDESPFALIHGHLVNFASLFGLSTKSGAFLCPYSLPPVRAHLTPVFDGSHLEGAVIGTGGRDGE